MRKKLLNKLALLGLTMMMVIVSTTTVLAGNWKQEGNRWWYQHDNGSYPVNEWLQENGKWYHFDVNGYMQTGWIQEGNAKYFFDETGSMITGKLNIVGNDCYFDINGAYIENPSSLQQALMGDWADSNDNISIKILYIDDKIIKLVLTVWKEQEFCSTYLTKVTAEMIPDSHKAKFYYDSIEVIMNNLSSEYYVEGILDISNVQSGNINLYLAFHSYRALDPVMNFILYQK